MDKKKNDVPAIAGGTPVRDKPLPFFRASIGEDDIAAVVDALRSGWLTVGPRTEVFERELCEYLGVRHVVAMSSCSDAMFLALKALGVGPGDEVITSALTFVSTVHAVLHTGATPVLADIESTSFGLDPESVSQYISKKTRAVLPVHFGGQACAIDDIVALARDRNLSIVEDAAHSFGASAGGKRIGVFGDATAFSFYATKNITTGEGGAIATEDDELADRLRLLSYHGMSRDSWTRYSDRGSWYYQVELPGFKRNMSDVLASLGISQLSRVDILQDARRRHAERYLERLAKSPYFELPEIRAGNVHAWHLFVVRICKDKLQIDRDRFVAALTEENIGSSVHFIPIHHHPFFSPYRADGVQYPVCENFFERCISLPLYPNMTEADVDDVVSALLRIADYYSVD